MIRLWPLFNVQRVFAQWVWAREADYLAPLLFCITPACKNEISFSSVYGCLHLGDMLEQAKSCHRAEGSFLPAAESPWAHGLKGFFNYRRGTRCTHMNSDTLEVGFPKCCFPRFIARELWNRVLGQAWCGAEKAAVKVPRLVKHSNV